MQAVFLVSMEELKIQHDEAHEAEKKPAPPYPMPRAFEAIIKGEPLAELLEDPSEFNTGIPVHSCEPDPMAYQPEKPSVPDQKEAGLVLHSIADSLLTLRWELHRGDIDEKTFKASFYSAVASLRGLADRFTAATDQDTKPPDTSRERSRKYLIPTPAPPSLRLGPNPFGLRLSHDGRSVIVPREIGHHPSDATQAPPWEIWSSIIPYRMVHPATYPTPHEEYMTAIQEWVDKEKKTHLQQKAAQQAGQQLDEFPFFLNTPPFWPYYSSSGQTPFDLYLESVEDTEAAIQWPKGAESYARTRWDAMSTDEKYVFVKKNEYERRLAWFNAMNYGSDDDLFEGLIDDALLISQ